MQVAFRPEAVAEILSSQNKPVGMQVGVGLGRKTAPFRHVDMNRETRRSRCRHCVLQGKNFSQRTIITFRPDRAFRSPPQ